MLLHSQQHRTRLDLDKAAAHASPPPGENRMSKLRCFCVRRDVQLWTCDHCLRAYKAWLCSSLFLRCNGASVDDGVTKPCLDMCWTVSRRSVLSYLACCVTADQKLDRMLPACLKTVADTCVPVCTLGAGPRLKTGTAGQLQLSWRAHIAPACGISSPVSASSRALCLLLDCHPPFPP